MKKIITAIGNPELNKELKKTNNFEVLADDIQYQDGIFELLEENNIDILILSELLIGEKNLKQLIKKIKEKYPKIKIVLLLEKENSEKIKIAKEEKIENIFFHNKISIEKLIEKIKEIATQKNIEDEIEDLKKLIIEHNKEDKIINKIKNKIKNKINRKKEFNKKNNNIIINGKIIAISGVHGAGKSFITGNIGVNLSKEKRKIIILDFDMLNQSINTLFGIKKTNINKLKKFKEKNNDENYSENTLKINSHLNFMSCSNFIIQREKFDIQKIDDLLEKLKRKYDYIIIDVSSECFLDYTKFIFKKSNKIIFITEANLLDIKKAIKLLNIYLMEWKIENQKINILFNKYTENCIDEKILKNIFFEFSILGRISFNKKYHLMVNKNMKKTFLSKKEKRLEKELFKKI